MRYRIIGLIVILAVGALGLGGSCSDVTEGVCGPCGDIREGDFPVTGSARIDGLFKAVGTFGTATADIDASFEADVLALGEVFGADVNADMAIGDIVAAVKIAIQDDISANAEGGLEVRFEPPKCAANVDVAVEAQASCEASAGCSADCDPGSLEVDCKGECSGSCSGSCSGGVPECKVEVNASGVCEATCSGSCELKGPSVACEGACNGTCTIEAGAGCSGTCDGDCTGTCDGADISGAACSGECEGECTAECHIQGAASCSGTCDGKCEFTPADGVCSGTCKGECRVAVETDATCEGGEAPHCSGSCEGKCSASCSGEVTPPSCSADCDATAECQANAKAQASASLECTPPRLEVDFAFRTDGTLDAKAKADFMARVEELKTRMAAIVQGTFKMRALVDAEYAEQIGITSPVESIEALVSGMQDANLQDFAIPAGTIPCAISNLGYAVEIMESAGTDLVATFQAQASIVEVVHIEL
jgi:hypothetical protein